MTYLVLVRHGETIWHAENRYAGVTDVALTPRGVEQAGRLAAWARTARLAGVWCSNLQRAQDTARASAEVTGAPLEVDKRLREVDFGEGEGRTTAEMAQLFPAELKAFHADPVASPLPNGEDPVAAAERFTSCLDDIVERVPEGRVLVVAHTTSIRLALCKLLGMPLAEYRRAFPFLRNCGITELRVRDGRTALLEFNTPIENAS